MTTRPFLYIAVPASEGEVLEKSWREDVHPRDTYGRFSTVKGGSRVVTKQGKTGVVDKVTGTHYHVTTDDGKKTKVAKDNAIHENDHKKVEAAKAKAAKKKKAVAKKAGKKQSTTKAQNKADGTHKKAKVLNDPTAKASKPAKKAPAKKKVSRKEEALAAPVMKRAKDQSSEAKEVKGTIQPSAAEQKTPKMKAKKEAQSKMNAEHNQAIQDLKTGNVDEKTKSGLSADWDSPAVKKLLAQPVEKRKMATVQKVASKLTEDHINLAHAIANKKAKAMGIHPNYNKIGNAATPSSKVINTETGMYADLMQSARGSMYETLLSVLSGAQKPGSDITPHVINRMKDKLNNDLYGMLNQIAAPHEVRPAIRAMKAAEGELSQQLGRTPEHAELADHLSKTSKHFNEAPIAPAPRWDDKSSEWVAGKGKVTDPSERLALLKQYDGIQRTSSADSHVGGEGEKEVSISQNAVDEGRSPEEAYERKERQKELEGALPKAMQAMGMSDASIKVWSIKHSAPSGGKANLTDDEVAEHINSEGGWDGKPISRSWVAKHYMLGRKVIADAVQSNHPAIAQLRLLKSFVFNMMLKAVYEYDLVKSIMSWGFDVSILRDKFVRHAYGNSLFDIKKSLDYNEYIGSYVQVDGGETVARIITHDVPKGEELSKAFAEFEELNKALFGHKDGGNNAINQKAGEYVKANKGKYKAMASEQLARISKKEGALTWSEQLQKEKGGVWINWGGKRILINADSGEIAFDSKNDAHREEHADGVQEDKLEYGHEAGEAEDKKKELMDAANADHEKGNYGRSKQKWAEKHGVAWDKDAKDIKTNEDGSLQFDHSKHDFNEDHGVKAFEESLGNMSDTMAKHKAQAVKDIRHKVIGMHHKLSDEQKEALHAGPDEERQKLIGKHLGEQEGVREMMEKAHEMAKAGKSGKDIHAELKDEIDALGKQHDSMALKNKDKMIAVFNGMSGKKNVDALGRKVESVDDALEHVGAQELSRAQEESNKKMLPEGHYEIGNKQNGKSMVVKIAHREDPESGKTVSYVAEAFDPKSGKHFTSEGNQSWGQLGKALGMKNNSAESFIYNSNGAAHDAVVQPMDEDEAKELRNQTSLGMQDSMLHKDFKMVDQQRDKNGNVTSTTYAQEMPDGTQNSVEVDGNGKIKDPVMARLFGARAPIHSAEDLHSLMKDAVGNKIWVTAHMGSDVHIGDALGHHVQIMYDGKGAPRVVGGKYDGYRYMDSADVPKGSIDAHTGEPIQALFKNGKLVDRKMTTNNDVSFDKGNSVMYQDGNSWKKGKIRDVQDGNYQVVDGKGNLIGIYGKNELKAAKEKGRTLSASGQAVVKTATSQTHRMNPSDVFGSDKKGQKAQELFKDALRKAKIARAFDGHVEDGNLKKNIELEDKHMDRLKKVLGRSKAGKELLKQFNSTNNPTELEMHVPEHLRKDVEAEGVKVGKDGKAKISAAKFEHLRDVLGGVSMDKKAQDYLSDHFKRKDRTYRPVEDLKKEYQPSMAQGPHAEAYRKQFKEGSFLLDPEQGLYGTQLEGISHLAERGNAIAGHGMGTGKTILGVIAAMHYKSHQMMMGRKPKKTLIVAPKGIMSDWGKEIGTHTNSKALYIGSGFGGSTVGEDGKKMWGQAGTEQEATDFKSFKKNTDKHASEDHDFHIVSYDTFMRNRDHFTNSGMYDNMAIDEVHAFKNKQGQRGKSLAESTSKFKNVWGLSGTPMENDAREVHSLIDTVTGGKHELGNRQEFIEKYMMKDKKGKITGVKPDKAKELGDVMANVVQFRGGEDVTYNDGSKIHFPGLAGQATDNENPKQDFVGNLVDRNRDHQTTDYYGTKHSIVDYDKGEQTVDKGTDNEYNVTTMAPKGVDPDSPVGQMYKTYNELQSKYLPESKLKELKNAVRTGIDNGAKKGNSNYLTAMQKLQKYINAPLAHKMFVPGGGNAIEADATNAQAETPTEGNKGDAIPFERDAQGNKRYYESDGQGGYHKNADGAPKLLPPLHHNNPKADYLKKRVSQYLDSLSTENANRRKAGKPELMPKVVVKSAYTTFGTDIVDGVLKDLQNEHPELQRWRDKVGDKFGAGRFTGDADDREDTKVGFRGNKKDYANNQGHLWATTVSPAGKEGVDFGNAHYMVHFDQDWNPQKMAQFTARVRRSDSAKSHAAVDRANTVRVESLHTPGTIEDFMFDAQDKKMSSIKQVEGATRDAELSDKLGETQGSLGRGHAGFTRGKRNKKVGAKPKKTVSSTPKMPSKKTGGSQAVEAGKAVASADKAFKLVVLL
jgi:preprotein translocase subunit YajC